MCDPRKTSRLVQAGSRWAAAAALVALLAASSGCATDTGFASDPLLGGGSPMPRTGTPTSTTPNKQSALPPMSAPSSSTSTAALTNGVFQPLDPRPELRTVSRGNPPAATPWKGPGGTSGAVLQPPEIASDATPRIEFGVAPGVSLVASRALTYEQAQSLLSARGVTWQRLEAGPEPGEWKFSCSIPNRQNPSIRRFYEARANDPVSALRAVVEQIDRERNP